MKPMKFSFAAIAYKDANEDSTDSRCPNCGHPADVDTKCKNCGYPEPEKYTGTFYDGELDDDPKNPKIIHSETDEMGVLIFDDGQGPTEEEEIEFFNKYIHPNDKD